MTVNKTLKKRFTIYSYNECMIEDNQTGKDYLIDETSKKDAKELCETLNTLHEENTRLREELQYKIANDFNNTENDSTISGNEKQ